MSDRNDSRNTPRIVLGSVLVVCALAMVPPSAQSLFGMRKGAQRVVVPAEVDLTFNAPGTYTIFHEYAATVDGTRYEGGGLPDEVSLRSTESGAQVNVERIGGYSRYSIGGERGVSAYRFELPASGKYTLSAVNHSGSTDHQTVLSIVPWRPFAAKQVVALVALVVFLVLGLMTIQRGFARHPQSAPGNLGQTGYTYANRMNFSGDPGQALRNARSALRAVGFHNVEVSERRLFAQGPGMRNTNQAAILGATRIEIEVHGSEMSLSADLGGVRFMRNFLYLFPPALLLGLAVLFGILSSAQGMPIEGMVAPLFLGVPWLFLSPLMVRSIRRRTTEALDLLLDDMQGDFS